MSIPWPGFSHHHIAQVTCTLAVFLSPLALTVFAKTTSSIVRRLFHTSGQSHQSCNLFPIHSSGSREQTASEADLKESLLREICQSSEQCADIPRTVFVPCEYCTCYLSDSEEGGDSPQVYQMEFLGSQRPVGDQARAGSINNHTRSSRGTPQTLGRHNGQSRDTNCSAELSNNPTKLCTIERIGDDSISPKDKQGTLLPPLMQRSDKLACDMGEHETCALDEHQSQEKTFPGKEMACENASPTPTSELYSSYNVETQKVRTGKKLDRDSTTISSEENATSGQRCQRKPALENVPEQDVKEADSARQRKGNSVDDAVGREGKEVPPAEMPETEAKEADRSEKRSRAGERRGLKDGSAEKEPKPDSQKREKPGEAREKSPKIRQKGTGENPPKPSKIFSRSSSCESFSTACDSSATSSAYPTDSEQDELPVPKSEKHNKHQHADCKIKESRKRHNSRGAPSDIQPSSSPIFEYATPPFSALSDRQDNNSEHSYCKTDRMYDDRLSKERDMERKSSFGEWLKSILKALLPFSGQRDSGSYPNDNTFHEYDIRNISNTRAVELWGSHEPSCFEGDQTYPHSCASSLCNFRLTLESWRRELVAMEDAFETSSQTAAASPCSFCHRDRYCQGLTSCKTMQLAQKFWSTIVELKQSHLRSCDCPRLNRRISEKSKTGGSRDDSKQRSAEPLHPCRNDFSGCSQRRYSSLAGVGLEAPCVHVLLYELDLLQKKLQTLTQSRIGTKSQGSETNNVTDQMHLQNKKAKQQQDAGSLPPSFNEGKLNMTGQQYIEGIATAVENATPGRFDSLTRSQQLVQTTSSQPLEHGSGSQTKEKSNMSMHSHSPATEELGELEELTDFFHGKGEQHISRQSNGNLKDHQNIIPEYRGSLTGFEATYKSVSQKPCDVLSHTNSLPQLMAQRNPQMLDSDTPKAFKGQPEQENEVTNMQVFNKTQSLGKFAEQYLGYIENSLDNQMVTPNTLAACSDAPPCGGDSSKTRVNINRVDSIPRSHSFRMYQASQRTTDGHKKNQPADESLIRMLNDKTTPAELGGISKEHSHDAITKAKRMGSFTEEQKNSNLKSAFDSIIADLIQFQQNQSKHNQDKPADAPLDKSPKNVKFSPSSTQKTDSLTNVSSLGDASPSLHCATPSNSSSSIEDCLKDLTVTEAFDQLDKIVDELLHLMDNQLEPCME